MSRVYARAATSSSSTPTDSSARWAWLATDQAQERRRARRPPGRRNRRRMPPSSRRAGSPGPPSRLKRGVDECAQRGRRRRSRSRACPSASSTSTLETPSIELQPGSTRRRTASRTSRSGLGRKQSAVGHHPALGGHDGRAVPPSDLPDTPRRRARPGGGRRWRARGASVEVGDDAAAPYTALAPAAGLPEWALYPCGDLDVRVAARSDDGLEVRGLGDDASSEPGTFPLQVVPDAEAEVFLVDCRGKLDRT